MILFRWTDAPARGLYELGATTGRPDIEASESPEE